MKNYTHILRQHNLKATPQRLAIADALDRKGHISLEDLYTFMLAKFESISLATIYKNINIMMQNCFIQEVKLPHAKSVYELTKDTHAHLACRKCNHVEDIVLNLEDVIEKASTRTNFQIESNDLVFIGVCKTCQ
ncbi:MAG: Fur family transcriptional regulator [Sulfurimonadaceae bacterium]|jgi:Fur family peroxide stress response transcriptional regulator|nr:Fur family transcriptional regulator [Sulfurimonadaceae bacterium]